MVGNGGGYNRICDQDSEVHLEDLI